MNIKQLLYLPLWYFKTRFLKKQIPLQTVLFISNICNYDCKHCCIDKSKPTHMSFNEIKEHLLYSYNLGSRFVDFEGGEPTLWADGKKNINDLCNLAHEIGFFSTTVTTNASNDFSWLNADHIFVSLDGINTHDIIRKQGAFEKLKENIAKYPHHKKLSVNMVITSVNKDEVEAVLNFVQTNPFINGISFNFYNPINGDKTLCVENKEKIVKKILEYKKRKYKIINTAKGLEYIAKPNFERVCWITNFITELGKRYLGCPIQNNGICDNCGLGMAGEMRALHDFSLETIFAGLLLIVNYGVLCPFSRRSLRH